MTLTVYGAFADRLSHIASLRIDALRTAGEFTQWRAIRARPSTVVTARPRDEAAARALREAQTWHAEHALPTEPTDFAAPPTVPCGGPPTAAYAEAVAGGIDDHVRWALFTAYWRDGQDIGNPLWLREHLAVAFRHAPDAPDVVSRYGCAVSISGGPVSTAAWRLVREWQAAWHDLGAPRLPVVVDGESLTSGYAALEHLGRMVARRGAAFPTANPAALPPLPVAALRLGVPLPLRRPVWWQS